MNDDFWVEESSEPAPVCRKRRRRVAKRTIEFVGWGSRPLIEFLEAIGQNTAEKHTRQEVAAFISKYINDKGLTSAEKKKKVLCDERLYALFGKKSVPRIKVYDMLEEHFAENHEDSDDDSLDSSDEDYVEKSSLGVKKYPTGQMKKDLKTRKSCFAAIIPENIELLYLKRTVVQELLKIPESFEFKMVGSFVRMKSDPNDIYQKNRFQLQQVTGIEKVSVVGDAGFEIHLRVSNFFKDVPICMLSDDNFSEEEVEDVRDRIKAGLLNRLTVNELQLKAQVLHVDIKKNWIVKEISRLQKLAEHANEKGWQREKFDYLERRKMLQKPSEQEKLLLKFPEVIAENLEPEVSVASVSEKLERSACSPKSILRGSSDVSSTDASGFGEDCTPSKVILSDSHALKVQNEGVGVSIHLPLKTPEDDTVEQEKPGPNLICDENITEMQGEENSLVEPEQPPSTALALAVPNVLRNSSSSTQMQPVMGSGEKNPHRKPEQRPIPTAMIELKNPHGKPDQRPCPIPTAVIELKNPHGKPDQRPSPIPTAVIELKNPHGKPEQRPSPIPTAVIELSDDDSEDDTKKTMGRNDGENPNEAVWHYMDPQGQTQGPFPLIMLKRWSDANYFHSGFTVWKSGRSSDDGIVLVDVLRRTFPF